MVPSYSEDSMRTSPFRRLRRHALIEIYYYRPSSASITGMFHCEIPDASGTTQNIYIGVYPESSGRPIIAMQGITFNRTSQTLTCTSTGGPPATITWNRNGQPLTIDSIGSTYEQSQRLVDAEEATYDNVLYANNVSNLIGNFTCMVSNIRGNAARGITVNDIFISALPTTFIVGQSARIICRSDLPISKIEWWNADGIMLNQTTSFQQLDLIFPIVHDNNHSQIYTCRITREQGVAERIFVTTVTVNGKPFLFDARCYIVIFVW